MPDTGEWLGQVLEGRYQVTAKIGAGGMAHIYKALHLKLERDVVVKVPRAAMLEDPDFAGRFTREIRSLVRLRHPFIVPIVDVGEHQGVPFMVLDYLCGGSLRDRLQERPQTPEELRSWLEGVSSALDFCHQNNCLHRDVKPDNILFDDQGRPALSDFGIAKVVATSRQTRATVLTSAGQVAGTPQYMAPELVMGQKIDGRVNQYALAVTVFEALTGKVPISAPSNEAVYVAQVTTPPEVLDAKFGALADVLAKALAKDPKLRYGSCSDFASAVLVASEFIAAAPAARSTSNPERAPVMNDEECESVKVVAPSPLPTQRTKTGRGSAGSERSRWVETQAEPLSSRAASELKALLSERRAAETSAGSSRTDLETPLSEDIIFQKSHAGRATYCRPVCEVSASKKKRSKNWLIAAGIGGALLAVVLGLWGGGVFRVRTANGTLVVEVDVPNPDIYVDGDKMTVTWGNGGKKAEIHVKPGTRKVEVKKDGFRVYGEQVVLEDGGRRVLVARLERALPATPKDSAGGDLPQAQNNSQENSENLVNSKWLGTESLGGYGTVEFQFQDNVAVKMIDKDGITSGIYVHNGNKVTLTFGVCVYTGTVAGQIMSGTARNSPTKAANSWTWKMARQGDAKADKAAESTKIQSAEQPKAPPKRKKINELPPTETPPAPVKTQRPLKGLPWISLFTGKNLQGWRGPSTIWAVEGGAIVGRNSAEVGKGAAGLFSAKEDYADFHLRLQSMMSEGFNNSGIWFRGGSQVRIATKDQHPTEKHPTGTLIVGSSAGVQTTLAPGGLTQPGKWFTLEILAQGPRCQVMIDGRTVVDVVDQPLTVGPIWLSCRPRSTVRFRNIEIKELRGGSQ